MTQRQHVETLLLERRARGAHSFEFYAAGLPRAAVVVDRLRKAGWDIDSLPEPSPAGSMGVRYILRSTPGDQSNSAEPQQQQQQAALLRESSSPSPTAHWRADL